MDGDPYRWLELYQPAELDGEIINHRITFNDDAQVSRTQLADDLLTGAFCELLDCIISQKYIHMGSYRVLDIPNYLHLFIKVECA